MEDPKSAQGDGFGAFFRRYTRTWQHAVATAALTAFGTLTFVHRLFAVVAILAYVLPPVVLYLREPSPGPSQASSGTVDEPPKSVADSRADEPTGTDEERRDEPNEDEDDEEDQSDPKRTWEMTTVPVEEALLDATIGRNGDAYAVGAEGAVLAEDGGKWTLVTSDGPRAGSNALRGVDAVAGGGVWFAGDGGAVGRLDPDGGRHVDRSTPDGDTTNVTDVAAAGNGDGDSETVLLVDGSGRVRRGRYREGEVAWDEPTTPGSGSSLVGVVLYDGSRGYACDTNQCVFETTDGGRAFEEVSPDAVEGTLTDVAASGTGPLVCDDDGVVHRRDGETWTPERLGNDPLWALDREGGRGVACGDGGAVYELGEGDVRWEAASTPTTAPLRGVALGPGGAIAVGDDGTVLERSAGGSNGG